MSVEIPERDGDGYLVNVNVWTPEIAYAMAAADGVEITDNRWQMAANPQSA